MNKLVIIGNLTKDPELKSTSTGIQVCTFTVAVNRRKGGPEARDEADFFRITAWKALADNCNRFLSKGRKVCVVGSVGVSTYKKADGETRATLEVTADEVEFLSSPEKHDAVYADPADKNNAPQGAVIVGADEELPF